MIITLRLIPIHIIDVHQSLASMTKRFVKTPRGEFIKEHMIGDFFIEEWMDANFMINQVICVQIEEKYATLYALQFS